MTDPTPPTDEPLDDPTVEPDAAAPGADLARRRFFRQFAGELIQGAATGATLTRELASLLDDGDARARVRARLEAIRTALVRPGAAERAAAYALEVSV